MKRKIKSNLVYVLIYALCYSFSFSQSNEHKLEKMDFNSIRSEIATYFKDGKLYVYRDKLFYTINSEYYDIYTIKVDNEKTLSRFNRLDDDLNTQFNEGPISFDEKNKLVYVTRNKYTKKELKDNKISENPLEIDIYTYNNDQFIFKKKFPYNDSLYSVGHACYSELTQRVYFTSNKPGGQGGTDIYYCEINRNGSYGPPINLGKKINTGKEEKFTIIKDGVLFFSSNGHHTSKDLDIYYITEMGISKGEKPKQLTEPLNSNRDDFGIALINGHSGYLSSNRGTDQERNHDIYYFDIGVPIMKRDEFVLLLKIENEKREKLLLENFRIKDIETNIELPKSLAENGIIIEKMQENHIYEISFDDTLNIETVQIGSYTKKDYTDVFIEDTLQSIILASNSSDTSLANNGNKTEIGDTVVNVNTLNTNQVKDTAVSNKTTSDTLLSLNGNNIKDTISNNISQKKDTLLATKIEDININKDTNTGIEVKLIQTSDIYFAFDKSELKEESKAELNKIIAFLNVNTQVKLKIWAYSDSRGSDFYNQLLSDNRAKSVYNYLTNGGLAKKQIMEYKGFGENKLVNNCDDNTPCTNEEHAKNRRVEFILVK